jgi:hypothetical protein
VKERVVVIAGIVLVVLIVGGMFFVTQILFGPAQDDAIELVPADSIMYGNVFLSPSNRQKQEIEDLLGKFPRIETPDKAQTFIADFVDGALQEAGIDATFEDDVEPCIDDQVAFFFTSFEDPVPGAEALNDVGAALVAVENEDVCRDLLDTIRASEVGSEVETEERSYKGTDYEVAEDMAFGFVEDFAVVGTEGSFKSVVDVAEGADSLADVDTYREVTANLTEDRLGTFYVDVRRLFDAFEAIGDMTAEDQQLLEEFGLEGGAAYGAYVESDGAVLESASPIPEGEAFTFFSFAWEGVDLGELPGDSWLALGIADLGGVIEGFFELGARTEGAGEAERRQAEDDFESQTGLDLQEDVFDALEDTRLFLRGGIIPAGPTGGVIVEISSEDKAAEIVGKLEAALQGEGVPVQPLTLEGYETGFTFEDPSVPQPVHVVADGDRIVGGFGDDATRAALEGDEPLEDSVDFQRAIGLLGDDYEPSLYLDAETPVAAIETTMGGVIPGYEEDVKPWVDPISHLTVGSRRDGDYILQRLVIGVEGESVEEVAAR